VRSGPKRRDVLRRRCVIERVPIAKQFGVLHDHAIAARAKAR